MSLRFHNTLTGKIEDFIPQTPGKVLLYTCGPTVYDYLHVGNWAAYIYWDVLVRTLMANDYDVTRVLNITDVGHLVSDEDEGEDKLAKGAKREGKDAWEVANFYLNDFKSGIDKLGLVQPQFMPRATDYINEQLELIRTLKNKGFTYQIDDGIYFDTSKFPTYADFAHLNLEAQKAGARVEFNPQKHNSSDFALWKFSPEGESRDMEWETPSWLLEDGSRNVANSNINTEPANSQPMGFPGWHLECSAMAMALLSQTLDIHTGGIDHIPVHHTDEIAQSEASTGVKFSNYWLHNNHLKSDGTKISKSLSNGYKLDDLESKGYSLDAYRMFILQSHYRSEGDFTFENLDSAKNRLNSWRAIAAVRHQIHNTIDGDNSEKNLPPFATSRAVIEKLNDDLNTPEALALVDQTFSHIENSKLDNINRESLINLLETIDQTLGLRLIESTPDISDDTKRLILERQSARLNNDWGTSDLIRSRVEESGITLRDTDDGTIWQYS